MKGRPQTAVFVISVAAEMAGMHPQTLRIYERKGLIEPYRTPGGTRRYSASDIDRLTLIRELTNRGLNLEGVRQVLDLKNQVESLRAELDQLRAEIALQRTETAQQISDVHKSYRREIVLRAEMAPQSKAVRNRPT
ncbi:MAG: heat shock protein transcriptional repressor HspR [Acidimicrobiia bacterium]